ncbi:SURF1 family protein [Streptomyces sp. JJ36]|uniref:SURF1 family cytochrome oxidase biogenesis protein n=1 Tax=Streptomyces sp. JJ36 TaxID=2736645 RepID=UPI001F42DF6D|nr:SURF1 family protein [Streptomyces sp. JJ36]MCF6526302.1 SURF1 family protein [Streptomyces sp. JJ36]
MYRFLLSRQWVLLTLFALALVPVMVELGFWQLHRHEARVARNEQIAESLARPAVPVGELTGPGRDLAEDDLYRTVTATGRYDTRHEVVVRQRTAADEQSIGYFVVTPLVRADGSAVLVNRGWVPAGGDLTKFPEVPPPPEGEVTVRGRIMPDETTAASGIKKREGLPPRQVMLIDSAERAEATGLPVLGGYVQLAESSPAPRGEHPERLPEPDHGSIGPHMAYAVQWWLFAAAVPVGWVVLVRRERRDRAAAARREGPPEGGTAGPQSPDTPEDTPESPRDRGDPEDGNARERPDAPDPGDAPDPDAGLATGDGAATAGGAAAGPEPSGPGSAAPRDASSPARASAE